MAIVWLCTLWKIFSIWTSCEGPNRDRSFLPKRLDRFDFTSSVSSFASCSLIVMKVEEQVLNTAACSSITEREYAPSILRSSSFKTKFCIWSRVERVLSYSSSIRAKESLSFWSDSVVEVTRPICARVETAKFERESIV